MNTVTKLTVETNPQRIIASDEAGIFAIIKDGANVEYHHSILEHSTKYYDIQGVIDNFTLFVANLPKTPLKELLTNIYHEIDICCISETDTVKMDAVREVLVRHGAIESQLY